MIVSSLPFNENAFDDDKYGTNCFPDYQCVEPNMFFDVSDDQYMVLPFLEDTIRSSNINSNTEKSCEEAIIDTDRAGMYLGIGQMSSCNQETAVNFSDSDQADSFDPQLFIKNLPELSDVVTNFQPNIFPEEAPKRKSVTLVLDLDGK